MKILAVETSTMLGGVAVVDSVSGLIAEVRLNVKTTHSERLMAVIDHALTQSDLTISDMDVFAVAAGPGSFTGLRIGLSTVKGLCHATGRPLVSVPTLEAFAWSFPFSRHPVCLMLDARKAEVYAAVFRWNGSGFDTLLAECSIGPDDLLGGLNETVIFAGEGALLYRKKIEEMMGDQAVFAPPEKMVPSPAAAAMLGLSKARGAEFTDPAGAVPQYIRRSEAEVKWKK